MLSVLLVAVDIEVDAPAVGPVPSAAPFLPACAVGAPRSGHAVRPAELVAYRVHPDGSRCLSLWSVPGNGTVVAFESAGGGGLVGVEADPLRDGAGPEFRDVVDAVLAPFGVGADSTLDDLFPGVGPASGPLSDVVVRSHRAVGDIATVEGLAVDVITDGAGRVQRLVDAPPSPWSWDRVEVCGGAAVREDASAVLLDVGETGLPAVGEMLVHVVPWVAIRARSSVDFGRVLTHLRRHDELAGAGLVAALDDMAEMQARRMERVLLRKEYLHDDRYRAWVQPTRLRSVLVRRTAAETEELDADLAEAARVVEHALSRSAEVRGARHARLLRAWSVLAGVIAMAALFAALAAIPATSEPTLFPHWMYALTTTTAIIGGVIAVVVFWRRP